MATNLFITIKHVAKENTQNNGLIPRAIMAVGCMSFQVEASAVV
jgi:hypothetical protein